LLLLDMPTFLPVTNCEPLTAAGRTRDTHNSGLRLRERSSALDPDRFCYRVLSLANSLSLSINSFSATRHFAAGQTITGLLVLQ
jgi:hypothetical protein